jgi:hypothetical protein
MSSNCSPSETEPEEHSAGPGSAGPASCVFYQEENEAWDIMYLP